MNRIPLQLHLLAHPESAPPQTPGRFRFLSNSAEQRLAWTRSLTAMRAQITGDTAARLAIGRKLEKFSGIYPGVAEEARMSLAVGGPLYLIGVVGGAVHAVIEALG